MKSRKSPRAKWYNYSSGLFFITMVTDNRKHFFGEIDGDTLKLSDIGKIVDCEIKKIDKTNPIIHVDEYVVMPNHVHLIIYLEQDNSKFIGRNLSELSSINPYAENGREYFSQISKAQSRLSIIVSALKSSVTRKARMIDASFGWQSRFHDHIIISRDEWNEISNYIKHNVQKWADDCFNNQIEKKRYS